MENRQIRNASEVPITKKIATMYLTAPVEEVFSDFTAGNQRICLAMSSGAVCSFPAAEGYPYFLK